MALGPWYAGDIPGGDITVDLLRDDCSYAPDGATVAALLYTPTGAAVSWPGATLAGSVVTLPPPAASLFLTAGPHHLFITVTTGTGTETLPAGMFTVRAFATMPSVATFKVYARMDPDDVSADVEIADALSAETSAQRRKCAIPADFTADLREALHRRVARNLALRGLPLAVLRGDGEGGSDTVLSNNDPEIRRLELGYKRLPTG